MTDKLYSLDYIKEISGGDEGFIKDMINTFIEQAPLDLAKIKTQIDCLNWVRAGEEAHKFASSLLFLQLNDLKQIAVNIEERGIKKVEMEQIPELFYVLNNRCQLIINQLKADFNL